MKKLLVLTLIISLLAACSNSSRPEQTTAMPATTAQTTEATSKAQVINPMVAYKTPDFKDAAGFALSNLPENYSQGSIFLIDNRIAQLNYKSGDINLTLRAAVDTGDDISGVYAEFDAQQIEISGGVTLVVDVKKNGEAKAEWKKNGYVFTLYSENAQGKMPEISNEFMSITPDPLEAPQ